MEIKDSVHGYIPLNQEEKEIVDTAPLQRLRRVRQLGLTPLVYPSATHTRFQHSLGVMHLAGKFAESLDLSDQRRKELRIAGLLHDSGHGPFSHASEQMAEQYGVSHEDFSCEVADRLEDRYSASSDRIHEIIRGDSGVAEAISGDIDADRMDYLLRDAHNTGVEHGEIDAETIIRLARVQDGELIFTQKAIPALEALLTSRFHMIKTVYSHHTASIAEKMLQRALDSLHLKGMKLERIMRMDDYEAHNALLDSEGESRKLYTRIKNRKLFKRALVWDEDRLSRKSLKSIEENIENPKNVEKKIADEADVEEHEVILDTPSTPGIENIDVKIEKNGEIHPLSKYSSLPKSLKDAEWRTVAVKVYSPKEKREKVRKAAEEVLKDYTQVLGKYMDKKS